MMTNKQRVGILLAALTILLIVMATALPAAASHKESPTLKIPTEFHTVCIGPFGFCKTCTPVCKKTPTEKPTEKVTKTPTAKPTTAPTSVPTAVSPVQVVPTTVPTKVPTAVAAVQRLPVTGGGPSTSTTIASLLPVLSLLLLALPGLQALRKNR